MAKAKCVARKIMVFAIATCVLNVLRIVWYAVWYDQMVKELRNRTWTTANAVMLATPFFTRYLPDLIPIFILLFIWWPRTAFCSHSRNAAGACSWLPCGCRCCCCLDEHEGKAASRIREEEEEKSMRSRRSSGDGQSSGRRKDQDQDQRICSESARYAPTDHGVEGTRGKEVEMSVASGGGGVLDDFYRIFHISNAPSSSIAASGSAAASASTSRSVTSSTRRRQLYRTHQFSSGGRSSINPWSAGSSGDEDLEDIHDGGGSGFYSSPPPSTRSVRSDLDINHAAATALPMPRRNEGSDGRMDLDGSKGTKGSNKKRRRSSYKEEQRRRLQETTLGGGRTRHVRKCALPLAPGSTWQPDALEPEAEPESTPER